MKKNEINSLRTKGIEQLQKEVSQRRVRLAKESDRRLKKEIAQILTLIKEKEIIEKEAKQK